MNNLIKNAVVITLLACAAVILLGVVFTPIVLAAKISLYWLFLYLLYFIVIVAAVLWVAIKYNYINEQTKAPKKK